ncbi:LuxR C-terminal-related transcriptional regulator [Ideonella sp. A 288]|uniref:helix-turn-helix transcriptional regulator n=1 Tax=Ideonella sp. A 288 TaxID=1962181 RepID=UPI001F1FF58B|nr:LuxR C-terminal-related transcriptional regulator [Ideonella sp. A 288]
MAHASTPISPVALPDDLLLKVTPPRVLRHLLSRARLQVGTEARRDQPVAVVQAPAGFGKTSLLAQWRREHLSQGRVVAWLSSQPQDDTARFVQGLALAVRVGAGRPGFGHTLLEAQAPAGLEGVTLWLAELAQSAMDTVLIVDEADRLPEPTRDALAYLLHNMPPNLRAVVAARTDCHLGIDDLVSYGLCAVVGPAELRFQFDETLELVRGRFGPRVDRDHAARLHELAEGWPLGLQLALTVMAAGHDPRTEIAAMVAHGGALRDRFVHLLLANLDPPDADFLTRIALLDHLHPALCAHVTQDPAAGERLTRLARDTPVFAAAEASDWLRLHTLARDELRERFARLPAQDRSALHARAAAWLGDHGLLDDAARHALAAGQPETAYDLAERSLYESLMSRGRQSAVLEWLARLPTDELDRRPRLLLAAAWSLALSERHVEASRFIDRLLALPGHDAALRCECALIQSGAAVYADDPDRFAELHDPWAKDPPLTDPLLLQVHANRSAFRTLLEGEPALARLRLQQAPRGATGAASAYLARWADFIVGLSYLWEGQVLLAEQLLRPTLARAEADLGRRSPFTCMLAAVLAAAMWERNQPEDVAALLANRLDVLEHGALPEAVLLGFRTMARLAGAEGAEHQALALLGALDAVGMVRRLPRLRIASLADQVRLHARRFRVETCRALCEQIDALLAGPDAPPGRLWRHQVGLLREVAMGHAAIAAQDWRRAAEALARADAGAQALRLGRLHIELLGLRAWMLDRLGEPGLPLLREATDLATTYGLLRVFDDAHPALGDWSRQAGAGLGAAAQAATAGQGPGPLAAPLRAPQAVQAKPRSTPSMALTPKEREVLELAARNLSNKEIGLAMQVGEETIKWHMKNLFAKLDAGTRKQVVQRARILGLLDTEG